MIRLKNYLVLSLIMSLLCGFIGGMCVKFYYAIPTSDWAANGIPLLDRFQFEFYWWLEGFIPGSLIGIGITPIVYYFLPEEGWSSGALDENQERSLERTLEVIGNILVVSLLAFGAWVVIAEIW